MAEQKGFSLVGVLVALVIMSVGMLGLVALQTDTLKHTRTSKFQLTAMQISKGFTEQIRANYMAMEMFNVPSVAALNQTIDCMTSQCGRDDMAMYQMLRLKNDLTALPMGDAEIVYQQGDLPEYRITIKWLDGADQNTFSISIIV